MVSINKLVERSKTVLAKLNPLDFKIRRVLVTFERTVSSKGVGRHPAVLYKVEGHKVMTEGVDHALAKSGNMERKIKQEVQETTVPIRVLKVEKVLAYL